MAILKLEKALYGCVESEVLCYKDLRKTLEVDNYHVNLYDLCVFNKVYKGDQITVTFHVDYLLCTGVNTEALEELYGVLVQKYKKM